VLDDDLIGSVNRFGANIVYLDPPYNERQYSKNYFPLNMIAMTPTEQRVEAALKGKTGIPQSCFMSSFCKKGEVESSFTKLFDKLKVDYIFVSYNSESLLSKEKMMEIMGKYGSVTVIERDYKRFKSFEYNEDVAIKEYLFCLAKTK
jgi:adenine-specific DNA-methyltransferase